METEPGLCEWTTEHLSTNHFTQTHPLKLAYETTEEQNTILSTKKLYYSIQTDLDQFIQVQVQIFLLLLLIQSERKVLQGKSRRHKR